VRRAGRGPGLRARHRVTQTTTSAKDTQIDTWYSGKHRAFGGNVQAVMRPDGHPIWTSPVSPGGLRDRQHHPRQRRGDRAGLPEGQRAELKVASTGNLVSDVTVQRQIGEGVTVTSGNLVDDGTL